ncbi:MAG: hypothetical protein Q9218_005863 [Villophora microphyllina]
MPIFQDPEQRFSIAARTLRHGSPSSIKSTAPDESQTAKLGDGTLLDRPVSDTVGRKSVAQRRDGSSYNGGVVCTSDRNELMERIKRGESPTWIPSQTNNDERPLSSTSKPGPTPLLPAADFQDHRHTDDGRYAAELSPPSEIKRPRSALHAGDFNKGSNDDIVVPNRLTNPNENIKSSAKEQVETPLITPWHASAEPLQHSHIISPTPDRTATRQPEPVFSRRRAPSLNSHSSSYVVKAPTTPLIQQSNSTDIDFPPFDLSTSPGKSNRRHTLPPRHPQDQGDSPRDPSAGFATAACPPPSLQRDQTFQHQTHRPRRSLTTSWSLQASPSPQRPLCLSSRRQSISSEASPLQYASMVGSYEESILRGWMSTAPSKPLDFTAQIGVMGKGNCKPKCPPHVTIPFPAVFYKWGGHAGGKPSSIDDEPSPYVGHIDLQQLPAPAESRKTRRSRSKSPPVNDDTFSRLPSDEAANDVDSREFSGSQRKRQRTSPALLCPQGAYRIPQTGQLQIVIKNPNKTAVKLFLVPYDLEDMEAGTKTFIRQRCYSAGAVIDGMPITSINTKPTLRYLIHVNIFSPSNGRFYLYQNIRVVFANRVPDNKEQLQTETQMPQPRYTSYSSSLSLSRSMSNSSPKIARDKAYRRRSSGFGVGHDGMDDRHPQSLGSGTNYQPFPFDSPPPPVPIIPFHLSARDRNPQSPMDYTYNNNEHRTNGSGEASPFPLYAGPPASPTPAYPKQRFPLARQQAREDDHILMDMDQDKSSRPTTSSTQSVQSPLSDTMNTHRLHAKTSDLSNGIGEREKQRYGKLNRGENGYGGRCSSPTPEIGEGLLARKLRGLGVRRDDWGKVEDDGI